MRTNDTVDIKVVEVKNVSADEFKKKLEKEDVIDEEGNIICLNTEGDLKTTLIIPTDDSRLCDMNQGPGLCLWPG